MLDNGLSQVENPSEMFLSGRPCGVSGSCVGCVMEGTRPILAEIQALVTKSGYSAPRRTSTGFDFSRLAIILAVLEKRAGLFYGSLDVYVNIVGGFRLDEPAADLPTALALYSSLMDMPINEKLVSFGEIGLGGEIRSISNKQCFLSGMSAVVVDTKKLSEKETPIYVLIAVILSSIILAITMDSIMIPVLFLASIGMAIVYNLGSNILMGQVSYITKALAAVLQLGVTMDYSIFLWHSYKAQQKEYTDKKEAMAHAIAETISSVVGSSITTVAGFVALCFMSFTLGLDLGIVMAKGVVLGVIACVTILPSLILVFDKAIEKTTHRVILPEFK